MPDLFQVASLIRAKHPELYAKDRPDAEVIADYRNRARAFGDNPAEFETFLGSVPDYKAKKGISELGGIGTGLKTAADSALMGVPELLANWGGTSMYNEGERERHPYLDMAGNVGGSIAGFGKVAALAKGGKIFGKQLLKTAAQGLPTLSRVAKADALYGALQNMGMEGQRQLNESSTNATGKHEGNPLAGLAISGAAGAAYAANPVAKMLALKGAIKEPGRVVKGLLNVAPPLVGHAAGRGAIAAVEGEDGHKMDRWTNELSNPADWAVPAAFGLFGHTKLGGGKEPWPSGAHGTPHSSNPGGAAASAGVPGTGVGTPPPASAAGPLPMLDQAMLDDINKTIGNFRDPNTQALRNQMVLKANMARQKSELEGAVAGGRAKKVRDVVYDIEYELPDGTLRKGRADPRMAEQQQQGGHGYWVEHSDGSTAIINPNAVRSQIAHFPQLKESAYVHPSIAHQKQVKFWDQPEIIADATGQPLFTLVGQRNQKPAQGDAGHPLLIGIDKKTQELRVIDKSEVPPHALPGFVSKRENLAKDQAAKKNKPGPNIPMGIPLPEPAPDPGRVNQDLNTSLQEILQQVEAAQLRSGSPAARPMGPGQAPPKPTPGASPQSKPTAGQPPLKLNPNLVPTQAQRAIVAGQKAGGQIDRPKLIESLRKLGFTDAELASYTEKDWNDPKLVESLRALAEGS